MTKPISSVAKIYANALIDSTTEDKTSELIKTQLSEVIETIKSSNDLMVVFENSSINIKKKFTILDELFGKKIDKKILNLIKILIKKNRFSELESIYNEFCEKYDTLSNIKKVEIISPIELNQKQKDKILYRLREKFKQEILPMWNTDTKLLAGLVFKFDGYVVDTSIKTKLENLSKSILR